MIRRVSGLELTKPYNAMYPSHRYFTPNPHPVDGQDLLTIRADRDVYYYGFPAAGLRFEV